MNVSLSWLPPDEWGVRTVPCGRWFDAVRMPSVTGFPVMARLWERSGPVIEDQAGQVLTWLVEPGTADGWEPAGGVAVWGRGRCLPVPPAGWVNGAWSGAPVTRWLIRPAGTGLTDAKVLRDALAEVVGERSGCPLGDRDLCAKGEAVGSRCDCPCRARPR
ncbi:hypothetical protein [Streptomyces sp. URMC 129]|uniref:hypothetical protein n=1 Tax=Streptomyces sp. URMC 129 TaxID=3423407 RepID=UPI003F1A6701